MKTTKSMKIYSAFISCVLLFASVASAATVSFSGLPVGGSIVGTLGNTVGWGYSIDNQSTYYLLPIGLSNSGIVFGGLEDIFDYPVVDPGQMVKQQYVFNSPGGFGNSLGLFEYTVPLGIPAGLMQSGSLTLMYMWFDDNPDLNPFAAPVGPAQAIGTVSQLPPVLQYRSPEASHS